jgi:hypothetical protein
MIVPVSALLLMLLPMLLGGDPRRLAGVRLHHAWAIVATFLVQFAVLETSIAPRWMNSAVHVLTYVAAGAFLWFNRRIPGLVAVGVGAASNALAIALNGGTLPASASALRTAGMAEHSTEFVNSGVVADARLAFLGDVFAIPAGLPLHNVFSIGDVVIVLGAGYASLRICGMRGLAPWNPARGGHRANPRHRATPAWRWTAT